MNIGSNNKNSIIKRFKNLTSSNTNSSESIDYTAIIKLFVLIVFVTLIIYVIICLYQYYNTECGAGSEKRSFLEYLTDLKNREICIINKQAVKDLTLSDIQLPTQKEEVFHIANQDYTYDQAKCKCESYGGKLATKDQIIDAYNKGASWCSYGWTNGQYAYYPVQQCEYDQIEENNKGKPENEKKFCGKPGINGGFFANPYIKFGVNCYGIKPKGESHIPKKPYCPPMNFCKLEQNFQASHKLDTDVIAPFAEGKWSQN